MVSTRTPGQAALHHAKAKWQVCFRASVAYKRLPDSLSQSFHATTVTTQGKPGREGTLERLGDERFMAKASCPTLRPVATKRFSHNDSAIDSKKRKAWQSPLRRTMGNPKQPIQVRAPSASPLKQSSLTFAPSTLSSLATVAGTAEPEYGPEAITSVAKDAETTPFTEIGRDGLAWEAPDVTSVETKTFYLMADSGEAAMLQAIYSNVASLRVTCQFVSKVFYRGTDKAPLWCSDELTNVDYSDDKTCFYADNLAIELSEDAGSYTIKSMTNENALINITISRKTPAFVVGKDGRTLYGTDPENPWGNMRHAFWPRCVAEGTITTSEGPIDFKGKAFFVHALQGMKPHHAAARWNFVDFQGKDYSALIMEFTTPPSYASTTVNVGAIVKDDKIVYAGCTNTATHVTTTTDSDNDWPTPDTVKYTWSGKTTGGEALEASMEGGIDKCLDRVDVMAEVPGFVKSIIAAAAGTKPYVYHYSPKTPLSLKLKIGDKEIEDKGDFYCEASFIC
ncbi:hypothetical protein MKZ38_002402 [Zalerion maritima]|uniref:Survival factor 1 n=1 Tax=Zalerion maritima TaxID=339359 RepID=A0AAD5WT69_9PEZI|nr:hypothetical protein MKZ38_002402 [Zalerion maritima]